jgi:chromosome segregation ATPase
MDDDIVGMDGERHGEACFAPDNIATGPKQGEDPRDHPNMAMGTDMMAVARRISERAQILEEELRKVQETGPVLLELRRNRAKERGVNDKHRKRLLEMINERNNVELEIFRVQEYIKEHQKKAAALERETSESKERIREMIAKCNHDTQTIYGPNLARMETYTHVLESIVKAKQTAVEARRKRLDDLRAELEDSKRRKVNILSETKDIEEAINREEKSIHRGNNASGSDTNSGSMSDTDDSDTGTRPTTIRREDQEITALSRKVREAIEEVSASLACGTKYIYHNWFKPLL